MNVWIDNTGLQSAALCLDGRANADYDHDVRGFLQLATLVIYGTKLSLNGFEDSHVANRSIEIAEQLHDFGIGSEVLSIKTIGESEYGLACRTAAESVAPEIGDCFNPNEHMLLGGEPPDLPRGLHERQVNFIELSREPENSPKLQKVLRTALKDKAIGAVEFMLAANQQLREEIAKIVKSNIHWSDGHSYQLNVFLRYHLNTALSDHAFSKYAPSVGRAELINKRNQYAIEALSGVVDKTVDALRGAPLGVPSTFAALLQRSKGEPKALLREAIGFRQHSKPLRDSLQKLATEFSEDSPEYRYEIQARIRELGEQLARDVGISKSTSLGDAVELKFVIGVVPVVSFSGATLLKWLHERWQSRKTAVLTELVKASAFSAASEDYYNKLCRLSSSPRRH